MDIDVKGLISEMAPAGERDEMGEVASEGMKVAVAEMFEASAASDPEAFERALRNFVRMCKY